MDLISDTTQEYNPKRDFTTLDCWIKARKVKLFFFNEILPKLPPEEKYQLASQIKNAIISITANIAEGYGRYHFKESVQFYRISRGSEYELKDHLITCYDFNYIDEETFSRGLGLLEDAKISINGFINYVKQMMKQ